MILLLGSGGYLGSILSSCFSSNSLEFCNVSRSYHWESIYDTPLIHASVANIDQYKTYLNRCSIIIYMAGSTDIAKAELAPSEDLLSHIIELDSLFKSINSFSLSLERFILFSSAGAVYGDSNGQSKFEYDITVPKSIYGKRNVILEDIASNYCKSYNIPFSSLRISNPFGPTQGRFRRKGLIYTLIDSHFSNKKISLRANGLQKRDYIYSDDFCNILNILLSKNNLPRTINICTGISHSAIDLLNLLSKFEIYPVVELMADQPEYEVYDSILSNALLMETIGDESFELSGIEQSIKNIINTIR